MQCHAPSATKSYALTERVCQQITEASDGRLVWKPFVGGSIVPAFKEFEAVDEGLIQVATTGGDMLVHLVPSACLVWSQVGGMGPMERYCWMTEGGGHELQVEQFKDFNVVFEKGCGFMETPEVFAHSKIPLNTLDDIKGWKIRTLGDAGSILDMMGAKSTAMPVGELYDAVNRGVLDACEAGGPGTNWRLAFQEIAPYMYISNARAPGGYSNIVFNKPAWEELPDSLKALVRAVLKYETVHYFTLGLMQDTEAMPNFIEYGIDVRTVPKEIVDEMLRQAAIFYDNMAGKDPLAVKILESQREFDKVWQTYPGSWDRW